MKRLMNWVMLSCRTATELMEKKGSFRLTLVERAQLFMHTAMCDGCRTYFKQSDLMDKVLKKQVHPETTNLPLIKKSLPTHCKEKIIKELEQQ